MAARRSSSSATMSSICSGSSASNAKNRLRSSMDMSATSRIVYHSMLDIVAARMTRRRPCAQANLKRDNGDIGPIDDTWRHPCSNPPAPTRPPRRATTPCCTSAAAPAA
ncbi:hypothetical protein DW909_03665 [Bifidobacterium bifidum]|nr:hypothetical protein DW909_03665 [Bifidobacterium bifidum]